MEVGRNPGLAFLTGSLAGTKLAVTHEMFHKCQVLLQLDRADEITRSVDRVLCILANVWSSQ